MELTRFRTQQQRAQIEARIFNLEQDYHSILVNDRIAVSAIGSEDLDATVRQQYEEQRRQFAVQLLDRRIAIDTLNVMLGELSDDQTEATEKYADRKTTAR